MFLRRNSISTEKQNAVFLCRRGVWRHRRHIDDSDDNKMVLILNTNQNINSWCTADIESEV